MEAELLVSSPFAYDSATLMSFGMSNRTAWAGMLSARAVGISFKEPNGPEPDLSVQILPICWTYSLGCRTGFGYN